MADGECDGAGLLPLNNSYSIEADGVLLPPLDAGDLFGTSTATGDFNGDGITDFAIGAPGGEQTPGVLVDQGSVHVYFGELGFVPPCPPAGCVAAAPGATTTEVTRLADAIILGPTAGAKLGTSLANAGDIDGDGVDDLLVGGVGGAAVVSVPESLGVGVLGPIYVLSPPVANATFGRFVGSMTVAGTRLMWVGDGTYVRVYLASDQGALSSSIQWNSAHNGVFTAATAAGDWNNDGFEDLALGCSECTPSQRQLMVFDGELVVGGLNLSGDTAAALNRYAAVLLGTPRMGASLTSFPDGRLGVGATHFSAHNGRLAVFGSGVLVDASDVIQGPMATLLGTAGGHLGASIAVGDPNGDGLVDIVGGAPDAALGNQKRGMVRFGSAPGPSGTIASPMFMWGPSQVGLTGPQFGASVSVGDVNGDLFDDILVGAPRTYDGGVDVGAVYLILGGSNTPLGQEVVQFEGDQDGDGVSASVAPVVRCRLMDGFSLHGGDCDESIPDGANVSPLNIEQCGSAGDEDCRGSNQLLCSERIGLPTVEPFVPMVGSTWCYGDASWQIGPDAADTVSVADLALMLANGELFFDDLDDGVVANIHELGACAAAGPGLLTVKMDVIEPTDTNEDIALSPIAGAVSDVVLETLRAHPDGYVINTLSLDPPVIALVGGGYPGLVNGAVDILRATEGGAPWRHRSIMDWPENRQRRLLSAPYLGDCTATDLANPSHADYSLTAHWTDWLSCGALGDSGRESMDLALRYHYSVVRGGYHADEALQNEGFSSTRDTTYFVEQVMYLRRRGIDYDPLFRVLPGADYRPVDFEPLGVERMHYEPLLIGNDEFVFPCDTEGCWTGHDETTWPGWVASKKYAMPTSGDYAGVVFPRSFLGEAVVSELPGGGTGKDANAVFACLPEDVSAACPDGPCFCVDPTSSVPDDYVGGDPGPNPPDFVLTRTGDATLYLGRQGFDTQAEPHPGAHDDSWYQMWGGDSGGGPQSDWGKSAFRPGRLYALHAHVLKGGPTLGSLPPVAGSPAAERTLDIHIFLTNSVIVSTNVSLSDSQTERDLSFVFRAPIQTTETPAWDQGYWNFGHTVYYPAFLVEPAIQISVSGGVPGSEVELSAVTVVELDGLSTGWMQNDLGEPTLRYDDAPFDVDEVSVADEVIECDVPGCVPYVTLAPCSTGHVPWAQLHSYERFVSTTSAMMSADRLFRFNNPNFSQSGELIASGVARPILGTYARDYCEETYDDNRSSDDPFVSSTFQVGELLKPTSWEQNGRSFVNQLHYFGTPQPSLPASTGTAHYSPKDYLFGPGTSNFKWHTEDRNIQTTIFTEVWSWNVGFGAWRDGIYSTVPNHQLMRALFCNVANVVDDGDWTDSVVPFRSYAQFFTPGELLSGAQYPAALAGGQPCDLISSSSSGVRVIIDANMQIDSTTGNFFGHHQTREGSLSNGNFNADIGKDQEIVPSETSIPNTLASNVDAQIWNYWAEPHDIFENLCDTRDVGDIFLDQPGVGANLLATEDSRNACMMTPLPPQDVPEGQLPPLPAIYAKGAVWSGGDLAAESIRNLSSVAAAHPDVITSVEAVSFDQAGGGRFATLDEPLWGYAARCMWNPGWRTFAAVSLASTRVELAVDSRWCDRGTAWSSVYANGDWSGYADSCGDFGNSGIERQDCVYISRIRGPHGSSTYPPLRMSIDPISAVALPSGVQPGDSIKAETNVWMWAPVNSRNSCDETTAFRAGVGLNGYALSSSVMGRVYFLDDAHRVIQTTDPQSPSLVLDCGSDLPDPPVECLNHPGSLCPSSPNTVNDSALLRPKLGTGGSPTTGVNSKYGAVASVTKVVPDGAAFVGVVWEVPGPGLDGVANESPVNGGMDTVLFSVRTSVDPGASPSISPESSGAFPYEAIPFGERISVPRSCDDAAWYWVAHSESHALVSRLQSNGPAQAVGNAIAQAACFDQYVSTFGVVP